MVQSTFARRDLSPVDDAPVVVAGAIVMAYGLADRVTSVPNRPPWSVAHPFLLHPVMWLVATASFGRAQ